jgi:hypothetical protein
MYRLNAAKLVLQRELFARGYFRRPIPNSSLVAPRVKKRRFSSNYHDEIRNSSGLLVQGEELEKLERYTDRVLWSQVVPLGTLSPADWDNVLGALEMWTASQLSTSGLAMGNAERLLERLQYEISAMSATSPLYATRMIQLEEMRMTILRAWLKIHRKNPTSIMAMDRSEAVLLYLLQTSTLVPAGELLEVLDGWLSQRTSQGSQRAAALLLESTTDPYHHDLAGHASQLGPRFDRTIRSVLQTVERDTAIDLNTQILERFEYLRTNPPWNDIEISEATLTAIDELFFQQFMEESLETSSAKASKVTMSPFEAEAMQKRMVDVLQNGAKADQEDVTKLIPRIEAIENPSDMLLTALVDFYLRVGDVTKASPWVLRLPTGQIFATTSTGEALTVVDRLLDAWSQQSHPQAPWRAEEVFRQILDRIGDDESLLTTSTMNRMLRIWGQSSDPSAHRKTREWFVRMTESMNLKPDESSLYYALAATDKNSPPSEPLYESILDAWDGWNKDDKQKVADLLVESLWTATTVPKQALNILARMKTDDLTISRERLMPLLRRALFDVDPSSIPQIIEDMTKSCGKLDLIFHEAAISVLMKDTPGHPTTAEIVWQSALEAASKNTDTIDSGDLTFFLTSVMKMYINLNRQLYARGKAFLLAAEKLFLPLSSNGEGGKKSLIPLDAYKALIVRKWYRPETAFNAIAMCERVRSLYGQGFINLRPDQDVYLAYIRAKSIVSERPQDLAEILDEMVKLYEQTMTDSCKPNADIFNTIFESLKTNATSPEDAWQQSLKLWKQMKSLDVAPDTKTLNLLILSAVKGENPASVYTTVSDLYKQFELLKLEPDSMTLHAMISACGFAKEGDRKPALNMCLQMFGEIRKRGKMTVFTYSSLTKSLRRLVRKGPLADKVVTSTLQLCYQDGLLAPEVRQAYQSMTTDIVWKEIYGKKLREGNEEPDDWHRRLPNTS